MRASHASIKLAADQYGAFAAATGAHVRDRQAPDAWVVSVEPDGPHDWPALPREALAFVRA